MSNITFWNTILDKLLNKQTIALLTIIDNKGSSPGKKGFKMAVFADDSLAGSVGGGTAEYHIVETVKKMMLSGDFTNLVKRQVHDPEAEKDKSGMICSGEQTVAVVWLSDKDTDNVKKIANCITAINKGIIQLSKTGLAYFSNLSELSKNESMDWQYTEEIGFTDIVHIFGGGHVSLEFCKVLNLLGYKVLVFDNRDGLSTLEQNNYAHEIKIIDYKEAGNYVIEGDNSYVVIMTVAHTHDLLVLRQMIAKKLKYLGMMGSKGKVNAIFDMLRNEGFTQDELSKIDMPIGIAINSKTPIEIAISIAAKMIQVKNS